MIKITDVDDKETFAVNEDYIITIADTTDDENMEANAAIILDTPDGFEKTIGVIETMDELYYEINRA